MTYSASQPTTYSFESVPFSFEPASFQTVAEPLTMDDSEQIYQRDSLRFAAMGSGYPGLIGQRILSSESVAEYVAITNRRRQEEENSENGSSSRQLIGYYQDQQVALLEYGDSRHRRNHIDGDPVLDVPDAHIETLALPKSYEMTGEDCVLMGAAMVYVLTLDAREAVHVRYRVLDPNKQSFDMLMNQLELDEVVHDVSYAEGGRFPGASQKEQAHLGQTLYVSERIALRQGLERSFPFLRASKAA